MFLRHLLFSSLLWSGLTGFCVASSLWWRYAFFDPRTLLFILFATVAGLVVAPIAIIMEHLLTRRRPFSARYAASFLLLSIGTLGLSSLLTGLYSFQYLGKTLERATTLAWLYDALFFSLVHSYSFAIVAVPYFLPTGLAALFVMSALLCRPPWHSKNG